jgi:hypothetical protein
LSREALAGTLGTVVRRRSARAGGVQRLSWWGAVAQLGERLVRNEEVSGSIPLSSTIESITCGIGKSGDCSFVPWFVT